MTRLLLVRHCQTDWNLDGRWQGKSEVPLNAMGWRQAEQVAAELASHNLDAIYSSPLSRSFDTAGLIARRQGLDVCVDSRLKEINLGEWEGMLSNQIAEEYPDLLRMWGEDPRLLRPPEGETILEVHDRAISLVDELVASFPDGNLCLVTHKTVIVVIRCHYLGLYLPDEMRKISPNGTYEVIDAKVEYRSSPCCSAACVPST